MSIKSTTANATRITYAELRKKLSDNSDWQSAQSVKNLVTALRHWQRVLKHEDEDNVGIEFDENFPESLELFRRNLDESGLSKSTIRDRISYMRRWYTLYQMHRADDGRPKDFAQCLRGAMDESGQSSKLLAMDLSPLSEATIRAWSEGRQLPSRRKAEEYIPRLEHILDLPKGILMSRLGALWGDRPDNANRCLTDYRRRLSESNKQPYHVNIPPPALQHEWLEFLRYKTSVIPPKIKRETSWRIKEESRTTGLGGWATRLGNMVCPSAQVKWGLLGALYGYLVLPVDKGGKGMLLEKVATLATLVDVELVKDYLEFRRERAGAFNKATLSILQFICSVIRPGKGYLWQKQEFGQRFHAGILSGEEWQQKCADSHCEYTTILKYLKEPGNTRMTRDPKEPIQNLLVMERPLVGLLEMVTRMEKAMPPAYWAQRRALHKRDILLVKMLICNPLRVHHFALMTYRQDNSGNLYQRPDGSWWLRFKASDFKNQRGAAKDDYDVQLSRWVWNNIEEYLAKYRQHLAGPETPYVFRGMKKNHANDSNMLKTALITSTLLKLTHLYIPLCPGFGPHAFRHIIATDYILNHPEGYVAAASILHDKIETVMEHYSHLRTARGFQRYTFYLDTLVAGTLKDKTVNPPACLAASSNP